MLAWKKVKTFTVLDSSPPVRPQSSAMRYVVKGPRQRVGVYEIASMVGGPQALALPSLTPTHRLELPGFIHLCAAYEPVSLTQFRKATGAMSLLHEMALALVNSLNRPVAI